MQYSVDLPGDTWIVMNALLLCMFLLEGLDELDACLSDYN